MSFDFDYAPPPQQSLTAFTALSGYYFPHPHFQSHGTAAAQPC